jgi:hypothetical protein
MASTYAACVEGAPSRLLYLVICHFGRLANRHAAPGFHTESHHLDRSKSSAASPAARHVRRVSGSKGGEGVDRYICPTARGGISKAGYS